MKEKLKKIKLENIILIIILTSILITSFLISSKTKLNSHPDEICHYNAIKYYQTHNLPPKFTSDEITYSYSEYGESRLTELDAYYFFAAKCTNLLNLISQNEILNARMFNIILLAIILIISYKLYKNKSSIFLPFLLTSQIWYIFSYINNDAWAIFLNLIFVYQLFYKNSIFNKLINSKLEDLKANKPKTATRFILLGLLFYFLLIVKINYLIATGISAIIYLIVNHKKCINKQVLSKIGIILILGLIPLGIRLGLDYKINGLDRIKNQEQIRLERADEDYKPPYKAENFKLKEKGEPIETITKNPTYYDITKKSFIGVYGYMDKFATETIYDLIKQSYIIFIIYIVIANLVTIKKQETDEDKQPKKGRITPLILVTLSGLLTFILSIYRSYTYDYQAQGRYLFPIIPLLCTLMYNQKTNKGIKIYFTIVSIILVYTYYRYGYMQLIS